MKTLKFKSLKDIPKLEAIGVSIEFDPQECDIQPSDCMDNDDSINYVVDAVNNGSFSAWFAAHVIVKHKGFEEDDYLGGCSYKSFKQFTGEKKGYYQDMIHSCIDRINQSIEFNNEQICRRWAIRKAKNLIAPYGLFIVSNREIPEVSI